MTEYTVPDCLVLKLESVEPTNKEILSVVYILYDTKNQNYVIRGQQKQTLNYISRTYSFLGDDIDDIADFLLYVIFNCKSNLVNKTLYNYDNLSYNSNNITYEFLENYDHKDYELSSWNNINLSKKRLIRNLRLLRNVFNYYN